MDSVQEFADGEGADRALLISHERLDLLRSNTALAVDEEIGVDQDDPALSGGPTEFLSSRRSSAKRASTGGADAIKSRNCSAATKRTREGASTAIGAPLRVISISSPSATRFRMSEK
jgi:hypothetical protein